MGGLAVKDVRRIRHNELVPTFEWVVDNVLPILGITECAPLGSFGKKPESETSGDIDIALGVTDYLKEGIEFEDIPSSMNSILKENGFETTFLKGFEQISIRVPIAGKESNGFAQVDLLPSPDLNWAKFMYHSPNLSEGESKYNGAVRNALLMAIISESTKNVTKLFEGKAEEYESLAMRFPTGVWNIKRSFMGKKGKIVQQGVVLESEFITRDPQDVIDLAFGYGYKPGAANSFETLWEIIHRKNFIHSNKLNEIMTKFKVNLKSMRQDVPIEAIERYDKIFEGISDVLKPKEKDDIMADALNLLETKDLSFSELETLERNGILGMLPKNAVHDKLYNALINGYFRHRPGGAKKYIGQKQWISNYLSKEEIEKIILSHAIAQFNSLGGKLPDEPITSLTQLNKINKERQSNEKKQYFVKFLKAIKGNIPTKSIDALVETITNQGYFFLLEQSIRLYESHPGSYKVENLVKMAFNIVMNNQKIARSKFGWTTGEQWGLEFADDLMRRNILKLEKEGNKQYLVKNNDQGTSPQMIKQLPIYSNTIDKLKKYLTKFGLDASVLNEEFIGYTHMSKEHDDMVGIYKNPENVSRFAPFVKALITPDGDMYCEDLPEMWLHKDMAEKLKSMGKIFYFGDFYDNNFVTMIRLGQTNAFGLTEGTELTMDARDIISKAQRKNPNLKLFAKHYDEIRL